MRLFIIHFKSIILLLITDYKIICTLVRAERSKGWRRVEIGYATKNL